MPGSGVLRPGSYSAGALEQHYEVGPVLGRGGYGTVHAGLRKRDGKKVVIKHISKCKSSPLQEVKIIHKIHNS